jgi:hypothetical protein
MRSAIIHASKRIENHRVTKEDQQKVVDDLVWFLYILLSELNVHVKASKANKIAFKLEAAKAIRTSPVRINVFELPVWPRICKY